ncbi:MAG: type IV toxin-antitoxin system AbiEi family antitoxin domain-containing protein [Parcubacteria group bacterium]
MSNLEKQLNKIQKSYFTFSDLRKIAQLDDASLRVTVSRLVKAGKLSPLAKGYYCLDKAKVDWPKLALEIYAPSYLSLEWVLGQDDILSQKTYALTLVTVKRAKTLEIGDKIINYRHLQKDLYFGYMLKENYLVAEPEKAFLDLAYLSLNGYAKFDAAEMNLKLLDKDKIKKYLKRFSSQRLPQLIEKLFCAKRF